MKSQNSRIVLKTNKKRKTSDTHRLSYCILTYNIQKYINLEGPIRTDLYQWHSIFQGKILHPDVFLSDVKDGEYDIVQISLCPQNLHLVNCVREKIGNNSRTKIIVFNEYPVELLHEIIGFPDTFKRELSGADVIACTHQFASQAFEQILGRKVYTIPYPVDTSRLKSYTGSTKLDIISVVFSEFFHKTNSYYFPRSDHQMRFLFYGTDNAILAKNRINQSQVIISRNYFEYCKRIIESRILYQQEAYHNCGNIIIDAAVLGVPVVGSSYSESMQRCFPQTSISPYDFTGAEKLFKRLKSDTIFYKVVSEYANERVDYYSRNTSKRRLLNALYSETSDKRFAITGNQEKAPEKITLEINKLTENFILEKITFVYGKEYIQYGPDEFVVVCLVRNGAPYIKEFISYYLNMGAKHIYFIDNTSTDKTCQLIKEHEHATIFSTDLSFKNYECEIRRAIIKKLCRQRWCLCIDIDEFFDFPYCDILSINQFIQYLNKNKYTAVVAHMLDMFSKDHFSNINNKRKSEFKDTYCYYDISQIKEMDYPTSRFECRFNTLSDPQLKLYYGGIRHSVFGDTSKFFLFKHPLLYIDDEIIPCSHPHFCNKAYIADIACVLKHYKFIHSFPKRVAAIVEEKRYPIWAHVEYNMYDQFFKKHNDYCFFAETSKKLNSIHELVENGFLFVSENYLDYINSAAKSHNK